MKPYFYVYHTNQPLGKRGLQRITKLKHPFSPQITHSKVPKVPEESMVPKVPKFQIYKKKYHYLVPKLPNGK